MGLLNEIWATMEDSFTTRVVEATEKLKTERDAALAAKEAAEKLVKEARMLFKEALGWIIIGTADDIAIKAWLSRASLSASSEASEGT